MVDLRLSIYAKMSATAISIASVGLIKLIFNIFIGRSFGEEILGEISVALAIIMIVSTICGAGISNGTTRLLSRRIEKEPKVIPEVYGGAVITIALSTLIAASVIILFSHEISSFLEINITLIYFVAIVSVLRSIYLLLRGAMYGLDVIDTYYKIELVVDLLFLLALFGTLEIVGYKNAFLPFVIMYVTFILISAVLIHKKIGAPRVSKAMFSETVSSSMILTLGTGSSIGMTNMGFILGAIWIAKGDIGLFSAAFQIAAMFLIITQVTNNVLFPTFARMSAREDRTGLKCAYVKSIYLLAIVAITISGTAALSAPHILKILYGSVFADASPMLEILLLGTAIYMVASPAVSILTSSRIRDVWISTKASILAASASILFWIIALDWIGPLGLPIGILIGYSIQAFIPLFISTRRLTANLKNTLNAILLGFGLFAITRVISSLLQPEISWIMAVLFLIIIVVIFKRDIKELIGLSLRSLRELTSPQND